MVSDGPLQKCHMHAAHRFSKSGLPGQSIQIYGLPSQVSRRWIVPIVDPDAFQHWPDRAPKGDAFLSCHRSGVGDDVANEWTRVTLNTHCVPPWLQRTCLAYGGKGGENGLASGVSAWDQGSLHFLCQLHRSFFVQLESPFLRPDPHVREPTRAGAVKVGRHCGSAASINVSRPPLTAPSNDGTLAVVGMTMSRGARFCSVEDLAPHACISVDYRGP